MVEQIQAKIVFDDASFKKASAGIKAPKGSGDKTSFTDAFTQTAFAQDFPVWGDILAGVGGLVLALEAAVQILDSIFNEIVDASPRLQATMNVLSKSLELSLRPLGDVIDTFLRPFAIAWLRFALPIYKSWTKWFGEGGGNKAVIDIGAGFNKIKEGLFNVDLTQIMEGFGEVFSGVKDLFSSFATEVLGPEVAKFFDIWKNLQEKFNTSGIFDTILAILSSVFTQAVDIFKGLFSGTGTYISDILLPMLSDIFMGAWEIFKNFVSETAWGQILLSLGSALGSIWDKSKEFIQKIGEGEWISAFAGLFNGIVQGLLDIAPEIGGSIVAALPVVFTAFKALWTQMAGPLVDIIKDKFNEKFPGLAEAIQKVFAPKEEGTGFFSTVFDTIKRIGEYMREDFNNTWTSIKTLVSGVFELFETGFSMTVTKIDESYESTLSLIDALNSIPKEIETIHYITTIRRSR